MTNSTERKLAVAAQALRAASPPAWDEFLDAVKARSSEIVTTLVISSPDRLSTMQGRAQEALDFFATLRDAPSLAEKLYEKERQNAVGSQPQANRSQHHSARR